MPDDHIQPPHLHVTVRYNYGPAPAAARLVGLFVIAMWIVMAIGFIASELLTSFADITLPRTAWLIIAAVLTGLLTWAMFRLQRSES